MPLTSKELSAIEDQLKMEQVVIKKCNYYAQNATDPQLKTQFQNASTKHQNHYNRLLSQLN
ncbi:spore coat protein [Marasmitruncus massiliensis]|uniref:spore coat protein n=1 Tax=Marasmitruncus massiliensis TaxID=1944642 RepID=UPI000C7C3C9E|nr:spore coat protein [Marasmitruncus massiliensis]MBE6907926.1 spore coat protein [Oscillospiraceae bacterium]